MKLRIRLVLAIIALAMLSFGSAHAQRDALCSRVYLPAGIAPTTICAPLP